MLVILQFLNTERNEATPKEAADQCHNCAQDIDSSCILPDYFGVYYKVAVVTLTLERVLLEGLEWLVRLLNYGGFTLAHIG
jgi:hypothetical protein